MASHQLYQLIISQLRDDGFMNLAHELSSATMIPPPKDIPKNRLEKLVRLGISMTHDSVIDGMEADTDEELDSRGINLDYNPAGKIAGNYTTKFITTHKESCRVARFSRDGKLIATGSKDTSIKLLDVEKMKVFNQQKADVGDKNVTSRTFVRPFYDHEGPVNDLDFHPFQTFLCSASKDKTIKFYDYKTSVKRSFKSFTETHNVRTINFHPTGDFLLVGTDHTMIRLYDVNTAQAFTCRSATDHHYDSVNQLRYSHDGGFFVSASNDGCVKIWDTVTNACERWIENAHSGSAVTSVKVSKNGRYLLSAGKDSTIKLWDLGSGQLINSYKGHKHQRKRLNVEFSHNEELIIGLDEEGAAGVVWGTRSGEILQRLTGHTSLVRWIAASPVEPALMSCSDDHRARFWYMDSSSTQG